MILEHPFGWKVESEFGVGLFARSRSLAGEALNVALSDPNRMDVFAALASEAGLEEPDAIVGMTQVHGNGVEIVGAECHAQIPEADALITQTPRVVLTGVTADCVPLILMVDGGASVVHAGWRGLASGVIANAVRDLSELAGPEARAIKAFVGPAADSCCYEVGDEVLAAIGPSGSVSGRNLSSSATAVSQLEAAGVEMIESVNVCTICADREVLNSFRRDGEIAERQGVLAWLN